jgi:hypothetical protein
VHLAPNDGNVVSMPPPLSETVSPKIRQVPSNCRFSMNVDWFGRWNQPRNGSLRRKNGLAFACNAALETPERRTSGRNWGQTARASSRSASVSRTLSDVA